MENEENEANDWKIWKGVKIRMTDEGSIEDGGRREEIYRNEGKETTQKNQDGERRGRNGKRIKEDGIKEAVKEEGDRKYRGMEGKRGPDTEKMKSKMENTDEEEMERE